MKTDVAARKKSRVKHAHTPIGRFLEAIQFSYCCAFDRPAHAHNLQKNRKFEPLNWKHDERRAHTHTSTLAADHGLPVQQRSSLASSTGFT
jgi:hypothetical protein